MKFLGWIRVWSPEGSLSSVGDEDVIPLFVLGEHVVDRDGLPVSYSLIDGTIKGDRPIALDDIRDQRRTVDTVFLPSESCDQLLECVHA